MHDEQEYATDVTLGGEARDEGPEVEGHMSIDDIRRISGPQRDEQPEEKDGGDGFRDIAL